MQEHVEDKVIYYYDLYPTEEDLMGETSNHRRLVTYLAAVLRWLFHEQVCAIYENLNFYFTPVSTEKPVAPDIIVMKDTPFEDIPSWRLGRIEAEPQVVFEILSGETWRKDLKEKLSTYERMGVQEYFAYDANAEPLARITAQRLFGWRRHPQSGLLLPLRFGREKRLWSIALESWLVPDGVFLRLYDRHGKLRLTEAEAMAQQAQAEAEARQAAERRAEAMAQQAQAEAEARQMADRKAQAEAEAREAADRRAQAEAEAREAADRRAQALIEKLRSLGHDPDQI